jgi:2-keto-3-deoxy-L-rhamnonate aldolase RhmA
MAADETLGREYIGHGYRMIATGTDQALLQNSISQLLLAWKQPSA